MPTLRRPLALLVGAMLLAACSAAVTSPTAVTSGSLAAVPTPTAVASQPAGSTRGASATSRASFAAMPGLTFEGAQAWAEGFELSCQTGLFPPNRSDELLVALCTRQSPADNAKLDLTIQYWPNNTVLAVSAAVQPVTSGSAVKDNFRTAFLQWASELPYGGADGGKVLDWLLSEEDCSAGCALANGDVSWTRTTGPGLDAVSAFVPE